MKKILTTLLAMLMISYVANAQTADDNSKQKERHHKGHKNEMLKSANLTDVQKQKLNEVNAAFKTKMDALKKNDAITMGDYKAKKEALKNEHKGQINALLTTEQKAMLEKNKAAGKGKKGEHKKGAGKKHKMHNGLKALDLTAAQETATKELHSKTKAARVAIEKDATLTQEQKKNKLDALKEENKKQVEALLTPEQKTKLATMRQHKGNKKPISK